MAPKDQEIRDKKFAQPDSPQFREQSSYKIVRTYSAGVFAGYVKELSKKGKKLEIVQARRLWHWAGAASLSQLAQTGTSKPQECRFPAPVDRIVVTEAIEILDVTAEAQASIEGVPVWQA